MPVDGTVSGPMELPPESTASEQFSSIRTVLWDLDGTLYPISNGYEEHVRQRIFEFMHVRLGVPRDQAEAVWRPLFAQYNQSLRGLRAGGFQFDTVEYWDFIRAGHESFLQPQPEVIALLRSIRQPQWVFTNCNEKHAHLALEAMGLQGQVKGVLGADMMGQHCKPEPEAFHKVLAHIGAEPGSTVFFEDSVKNLRQANELGMVTVLVAGPTAAEEAATRADIAAVVNAVVTAPTLSEVRRALPQLWA